MSSATVRAPGAPDETAFKECPYVGIRPYAEEQAAIFRGREELREIICANIRAWRLTLLYGPSGVGKSSLLHAGVAHQLRQAARSNLKEFGSADFVPVVFDNWPGDPLKHLSASINDVVAKTFGGRSSRVIPPVPSPVTARVLEAWTRQNGLQLLLIFDQFEEYFLYHPRGSGSDFAAQFAAALASSKTGVNFLLSIREDQLARLDRFENQIPRIFENFLRIEHLDRNAAKKAICEPLNVYNEAYQGDFTIEDSLVEKILDQVGTGKVTLGQAGRGAIRPSDTEAQEARRIEAPFLQLVLARLWEEETRANSHVLRDATFDRLGGAERIVETHLDSVMNALTPSERNAARMIFHHLVTPSGAKIAHSVEDLVEYTDLPQEQIERVLQKLSVQRILRSVEPPPHQPDVRRYEIFHDVLARAVSYWRVWSVQSRLMSPAGRTFFVAWIVTYFLAVIAMLGVYLYNPAWLSGLAQAQELRPFLLVVACAAGGGLIHVVRSFAEYVANRQLVRSWGWWYLLRPFLAVTTATVAYFAFRGMVAPDVNAQSLNQYAIGGLAGLTGMFSKQLIDKLREIAETLLATGDPIERADLLEEPAAPNTR